MKVEEQALQAVWENIDSGDIAQLALELGGFRSSTTQEAEVAAFLEAWLVDNGFSPRRVALVPERPNLMATVKGEGRGPSLLFNSHMDIFWFEGDRRFRDPSSPIYHTAWREGEWLRGAGVVNDKGPMASWLVAARALVRSGVKLQGDLLLTMVSGEIGHEPIDEFQGLGFSGKDLGTRYLVTHGGVADYALVAEATNFTLGWVEAGKAFFKVRIMGGASLYTPFIPDGAGPGAIVKAGRFLNAWDEWATAYTARHRYECEGGVVEPRASIGAIRAGHPYAITRTSEVCDLYLDLRTAPGQSPTETQREVYDLVDALGMEAEVSLYLHRPGYEAHGADRLVAAVQVAHQSVFGDLPRSPSPPSTSMWRDTNPFNEAGVPAVMYGPTAGAGGGTFSVKVDDLHKAALVYAATALELCG